MPATEIHHQKDGVLVSWWHSCRHFSLPIPYNSVAEAEAVRAAREAMPCFECRHPLPPRQWGPAMECIGCGMAIATLHADVPVCTLCRDKPKEPPR